MSKLVTMKMWEEAGDFSKIAEPGDTVEESIVEQFMNSVPPVSLKPGYLQAGEPYDTVQDENEIWRHTYTTFVQTNDGWVFSGYCFKGKTVHQSASGDPWK